ncbi:unnamed protein product [Dovyalis caffra]|uniref:Uncharacterized protein n=1 Tax=Dovyalis caffra TaxID=77055 RepID=A0AAV1R4C1_9ROSI|nr:unnamed protein product [Dovyalis caffra]
MVTAKQNATFDSGIQRFFSEQINSDKTGNHKIVLIMDEKIQSKKNLVDEDITSSIDSDEEIDVETIIGDNCTVPKPEPPNVKLDKPASMEKRQTRSSGCHVTQRGFDWGANMEA